VNVLSLSFGTYIISFARAEWLLLPQCLVHFKFRRAEWLLLPPAWLGPFGPKFRRAEWPLLPQCWSNGPKFKNEMTYQVLISNFVLVI